MKKDLGDLLCVSSESLEDLLVLTGVQQNLAVLSSGQQKIFVAVASGDAVDAWGGGLVDGDGLLGGVALDDVDVRGS